VPEIRYSTDAGTRDEKTETRKELKLCKNTLLSP
jgi:hypothetical protein